jgi:hypothetical protein
MTRQLQSITFAACVAAVVLIGMASAQAKQCSGAVPADPRGHWSYRLIDGRKCWYEGDIGVSKSSLQWSAKSPAQQSSDRGPDSAVATKPDDAAKPDDTASADACCWPALNNSDRTDSDSFEARWRSLLDAMGKY